MRERGFAIIGLGYVGLPVALALARHFDPVVKATFVAARLVERRQGFQILIGYRPPKCAARQGRDDFFGTGQFFLLVGRTAYEDLASARRFANTCRFVWPFNGDAAHMRHNRPHSTGEHAPQIRL